MIEQSWLMNASINQLQEFLCGRFQGIGPQAADTGAREAELPHELPIALWEEADGELRSRIIKAIERLLQEIPGQGWTPRAVEWLAFFIARANINDPDLVQAMAEIARNQAWLDGTEDGIRRYKALLRTLLDLGWAAAEPRYWLDLPKAVQKEYPGLVFRGLLALGEPSMAYTYLPRAIKTSNHARQVIDVLSDAMEQAEPRKQALQHLACVLPQLPPPAADELRRWFRVYGWGDLTTQRAQAEPPPSRRCFAAFDHAGWRCNLVLANE